jgi:membrane protease YdiL (CAAX protease family)
MILLNDSTIVVFSILTIAIVSVWLPKTISKIADIPIWIILALTSCLLGLYYSIVELGGIIYLFALGFFCELVKFRNKLVRITAGIIVFGFTASLVLHLIPFFNNPLVFNNYLFSDQSIEYTKYWKFDKAAAGLILLAYFGDTCKSVIEWRKMLKKTYLISVITIAITIALSIIFKYIKLDITIISLFFIWAWANLLFTCISEEMLFRGFIQKHLMRLTNKSLHQIIIVIFVGILFGAAHYTGGATYAIVASIAGIGYGFAYYRTGKIESAILTHFLLNSVHFLFFTYPFTKTAL